MLQLLLMRTPRKGNSQFCDHSKSKGTTEPITLIRYSIKTYIRLAASELLHYALQLKQNKLKMPAEVSKNPSRSNCKEAHGWMQVALSLMQNLIPTTFSITLHKPYNAKRVIRASRQLTNLIQLNIFLSVFSSGC